VTARLGPRVGEYRCRPANLFITISCRWYISRNVDLQVKKTKKMASASATKIQLDVEIIGCLWATNTISMHRVIDFAHAKQTQFKFCQYTRQHAESGKHGQELGQRTRRDGDRLGCHTASPATKSAAPLSSAVESAEIPTTRSGRKPCGEHAIATIRRARLVRAIRSCPALPTHALPATLRHALPRRITSTRRTRRCGQHAGEPRKIASTGSGPLAKIVFVTDLSQTERLS
jgi:hypothetical protein